MRRDNWYFYHAAIVAYGSLFVGVWKGWLAAFGFALAVLGLAYVSHRASLRMGGE